jgi:hypothetical protein
MAGTSLDEPGHDDYGRRHREERSDEAIQNLLGRSTGLLSFARNDVCVANPPWRKKTAGFPPPFRLLQI